MLDISRRYPGFSEWSGIRYKIITSVNFGLNSDRMTTGFLSDISVGGISLGTDKLFPTGTELQFKSKLYEESAFKQCKGRVAWGNRKGYLKKQVSTGMCIEFIDIK